MWGVPWASLPLLSGMLRQQLWARPIGPCIVRACACVHVSVCVCRSSEGLTRFVAAPSAGAAPPVTSALH
jgi:hypothetical protein